ncbi:unnamed protein product [Rotaria sp. Silwood2]|nr:unnamed protein product [Rotaria sp. Silwood2]
MAGLISTITMMFVFLIFYGNIVSCTSNNTTQFDNFTIEWQDFNLFSCVVPATINVSLFTCLPSASYTQVDDITCLNVTLIDYDQNICQVTTDTTVYTISTSIGTQQTTTLTSTYAQIETSISMTTVITQSIITTLSITSKTSATTETTDTLITTVDAATNTLTTTTTTMSITSQASTPNEATYTSTTTVINETLTSTTSSAVIYLSTTTMSTTTDKNTYSCQDNSYIGTYCNVSSDACAMSQPCENAATCIPNNTLSLGYYCQCQSDYEGYNCQYDNRVCMESTCWHNGTCISVNSTVVSSTYGKNFKCECIQGYDGVYCELSVDLCGNITCENEGICQTVELVWKCLCVNSKFYYGDFCQFKTSTLVIKEILSKSFASIAIGAIATTCAFVIVMDVLKYVFHIDPVETERDNYRKRREEQRRARQPIKNNQWKLALRFQYVS